MVPETCTTVVCDEDGEYVLTVYPAHGVRRRNPPSIETTSCAEGRLRGVRRKRWQAAPRLEVDIEVEGQSRAAGRLRGHYTFPQPDGAPPCWPAPGAPRSEYTVCN